MDLLFTLLAVVAVAVVIRLLSRPHLVVQITGGWARVVRGTPPAGLLRDLGELARHHPQASGRVEVRGARTRLVVRAPGLDDSLEQRALNVVYLYRDRLG